MPTPYEREIEEILRNLGPIGPQEPAGARFRRLMLARWQLWMRRLRTAVGTVPAEQLMLAALVFVVAAYFLRFVLPGVARFVGLAGLVMFVLAFFLSFNQLFGAYGRDTRWRGRPVNMRGGQPTLLDRFVFWLRRRIRGY